MSDDTRMVQMNQWGVRGCRERREEIVGWLREQKEKRGWAITVAAAAKAVTSGLVLKLNPLDPLGSLVEEAIRRVEVLERARR